MAAGFPVKANYATGDVLSATNMNDLSGTINLINPSAKGDLYAGSAANTYTKLAVGTNGQVLTADSTAATGIKWATPSAGASYVGAAVYINSGSVSYTQNVAAVLTPTASDWDTNSFWSSGTNPSRLTIPTGKGGKYQITCSHRIGAGWNYTQFYVYKNGSAMTGTGLEGGTFSKENQGGNSNATNGTVTVSGAAGDYFQIYIQTDLTTGSQTTWYRCQIDYLGA